MNHVANGYTSPIAGSNSQEHTHTYIFRLFWKKRKTELQQKKQKQNFTKKKGLFTKQTSHCGSTFSVKNNPTQQQTRSVE